MSSHREPSVRGYRIRGLVVIALVAVLGVVVWQKVTPAPVDGVRFALVVTDLGDGVGESTPVRLRGLTVGEVIDHRPHGPGRQLITLSVDDERFGELSDELGVRFISGTVFGSTAVELVPAGSGAPLRSQQVLDLGNRASDDTITTIMRDSGRLLIDVVNRDLATSMEAGAELTDASAPLLASGLVVLRTMQKKMNLPMAELLPKLANASEGTAAFMPSSLGILKALASVKDLDDSEQVELANGTIIEVSNLVFSFAGRLVGALAPMAGLMDAMLDLVIPINQGMQGVTPQKVERLLDGLDGALDARGDRVDLDTEILLKGFPAFGQPLAALDPVGDGR
ncbi:Mce family protein [Gordonia sp. CNJ-863]|uniref:Mce family protein n=1 Tax=Gordonia sp. CNJ-863 TaxID=1904963 RepID=UPI0009684C95|nr:Mce family protein [Gordonia sp. CNJ-863]OLT45880.1 Mce family protein [Gordonia sp. CNJ-863]